MEKSSPLIYHTWVFRAEEVHRIEDLLLSSQNGTYIAKPDATGWNLFDGRDLLGLEDYMAEESRSPLDNRKAQV